MAEQRSGGGEVTIEHLAPSSTVGYVGDPALYSSQIGGGTGASFYGSAYTSSTTESAVAVDRPDRAASFLAASSATGVPAGGLYGSYIGVVADAGSGGVSVFGDPSGNRNPFVRRIGDGMVFASHPLTCASLAGDPRIDRANEDFFLVYGFHPDGRTVYEGVRQVAPSSRATWRGGGGGVEIAPAGERLPAPADHSGKSRQQLIAELYRLLVECTTDQLCDAERVGVLLGGFDSALVAALLKRAGREVTTFSFRYADASFNQGHTDTLQRHLGTEHRWVDIEPGLLVPEIREYGARYVQPTNWLNYVVQTALVAARMREMGIRNAYSGDGCDALFLGYPGTYQRTRIFARLPRLPTPAARALTRLAAWPWLERTLGHPHRMILNVLRATGRPMPARGFLTFRVFDELSLRQMRRGEDPRQRESLEETVSRLAAPHAGQSLQRLGYVSKGLSSPSKIKQLAVTDNHGVTIHAPYMHPRIKSFLANVPDDLLRREDQSALSDIGKGLLVDCARRHELLPDESIFQPKLAAVDSPVDRWYGNELREEVSEMLASLPFPLPPSYRDSLLADTWAARLYKRHVGSTRVASDGLSLLLSYASACRAAAGG